MTAIPEGTDGVARRALPGVIRFFESLTAGSLAEIDRIYGERAAFRDPFSEVSGVLEIRRIYAHMFERLEAPRFVVLESMAQDDRAFIVWDMEFRFRGGAPSGPQRIHGATRLRFDADGRIADHRDYWDAAEELYAKLPVLGALMRWLRRRAAA